jgi:alpha-tubulin suppressor-like RCC1 family protein
MCKRPPFLFCSPQRIFCGRACVAMAIFIITFLPDHVASSGSYSSCAIATSHNNSLWCWGMNDDGFGRGGNIGDGTMLNRWTPTAVSGLNSGVTMVSFGIHHTCAIVGSSAALKCWGYNGNGAIGDGTNTNRLTPVAVG